MSYIETPRGRLYFKQKFLFPGCHVINRKVAFDNLKRINEVLSLFSIHWGVVFGSLLGIVRDNDFIEWDEDTDLYILDEEEMEFRNALCKLRDIGFELIRYERAGLYSIWRDGEYIDFYVLRRLSDEIRYTSDGCFVLEKYIKDRKKIDFKGIPLFIPKDVDEYLSLEYGNWQVPVRFYSPKVNSFRRLGMILYCYFRLYSPDFLYFWWIEKLRAKDLDKFVVKCQEKGILINNKIKMKVSKSRI